MTAEPKHTPGPWYVHRSLSAWNERICIYTRPDEDDASVVGDSPVAVAYNGARHWDTKYPVDANAALIAAAPDMAGVLDEAPVPSKYHGANGFEVDRFLADYEAWMGRRRAALAKAGG